MAAKILLIKRAAWLILLAALNGCASRAVEPAIAEPTAACSSAAQRQFDFWLGDWEVAAVDQAPHATNRISRQAQGCALLEQYQTQSGYTGLSLNWYDPKDQAWHQTWTDNSGVILHLRGGLNAAGQMVLAGDRIDGQGQAVRDRISWTALPDGRVAQRWDVSRDNGNEWETIFDGRYRRLEPAKR